MTDAVPSIVHQVSGWGYFEPSHSDTLSNLCTENNLGHSNWLTSAAFHFHLFLDLAETAMTKMSMAELIEADNVLGQNICGRNVLHSFHGT